MMTGVRLDPELWRAGERVPEAVHAPATVEEVADLLAAASRDGRMIVPSGGSGTDSSSPSGSGSCAILPPEGPYSILSTQALAGISEYEPANLTVTAGAGTSLSALTACTAEHGQWLPVDPPGSGERTLGALLASGASGPLRAGFGRPRDHALGMTVVTGDGRILEAGGRVVKNVAGYDLVRLLVGSRGRLGVIVSATARLYPLPESDVTLVYEMATADDAAVLARRFSSLPVPIAALELLDPGAPHPPRVVVRIMGGAPAVDETLDLLRREGRVEEVDRFEGAASGGFFQEMGARDYRAASTLSLAFRPSRLAEAVELVREVRDVGARGAGEGGARSMRFAAHAMSGVGRIIFDAPPSFATWTETIDIVTRKASGLGMGCRVTGAPAEHLSQWGAMNGSGAGASTRHPEGPAPASRSAVARLEARLKAAFDPNGVLP